MKNIGFSPLTAAIVVVVILAAGAGAYFLTRGPAGGTPQGGSGEPQNGEENQGQGPFPNSPYYHRVYSATSSDGVNWVVDNTLLLDHASVPGAVYFNNKVYLYFVNASDWQNEKLSVAISQDRGATFTVQNVQITGSNSPYPVDPHPIVDNGKIRLTYFGNFMQGETGKMVTATSSDGINFTDERVLITGNFTDPDLFYDDVRGEWVLFLSPTMTKATAPSITSTFTTDQSFSWNGSVSSTHKIGNKYYTYYIESGAIAVAEYSNGALTSVASRILNYSGLNADPSVVTFGANDYKMFFKTQVGA
ncbi:MAG: hypothetical protein AB1305_01485 [Candidatus Hadarchaeota archaeon]